MTYNTQLALACALSIVVGAVLAVTLESAWTERNARLVEMQEVPEKESN